MTYVSVQVGVPCGTFQLDPSSVEGPLVFLSAGVGITPLMAMLEATLAAADTNESDLTMVQCCRYISSQQNSSIELGSLPLL